MARRSTWWRRLRGFAAACLLVMVASAPWIDAIICQDDAVAVTAQLTNADVAASAPVSTSVPRSGDTGDVCPHGHCHHFSVYVDNQPMRQAMTPFLEVRLNAVEQIAPPSLPGGTPERPPRV